MESESKAKIPKIDFSGLKLSKVGTKEWDEAKEKVMEALEKYGCFEAVFDRVTMETRDEFFGPVLDELFKVPLDVKIRNYSDVPFQAYIPRRPELGFNFESLNVNDASSYSSIQTFASLIWMTPQENHAFCEVAWRFAREVSELELMVRRMVVEGLGVEKHFESFVKSTIQTMRMAEYGAPMDQETMVAMGTHCDMNLITIICQHHGEGLELQTKSGDWFRASPCSFNVILSESFQAWSNGRLTPTPHRVKMLNNDTRHSIGFGSQFKDGCMIQAPDELVNQDHPLLYKHYTYEGYLNFLFSKPWGKGLPTIKAYCGVEEKEMVP